MILRFRLSKFSSNCGGSYLESGVVRNEMRSQVAGYSFGVSAVNVKYPKYGERGMLSWKRGLKVPSS